METLVFRSFQEVEVHLYQHIIGCSISEPEISDFNQILHLKKLIGEIVECCPKLTNLVVDTFADTKDLQINNLVNTFIEDVEEELGSEVLFQFTYRTNPQEQQITFKISDDKAKMSKSPAFWCTRSQYDNVVLFVGNTGVGKSFVCNKIVEMCGNPKRFESSSSNISITKNIQTAEINYKNKTFTIMDTQGSFDVSHEQNQTKPAHIDGENTCGLINALKSCMICAVVVVYTTSEPIKIWYNRSKLILGPGHASQILLLQNKMVDMTEEVTIRNQMKIQKLVGDGKTTVPYLPYSFYKSGEDASKDTQQILEKLINWTKFKLANPTIREVCYKPVFEEGPVYEEIISTTDKDEGQMVTTAKEGGYYTTYTKSKSNPLEKAMGHNTHHILWVPRTVTEKIWVPKLVTYKEIHSFKNIYKVRYDGTKDFVEKRKVGQRTETRPITLDVKHNPAEVTKLKGNDGKRFRLLVNTEPYLLRCLQEYSIRLPLEIWK